jgi:hypothetical protein
VSAYKVISATFALIEKSPKQFRVSETCNTVLVLVRVYKWDGDG